MANYAKHKHTSEKTQAESMAVARGTQKPGQTKAQTQLIAKGIENGIEIYKKQQKAKARELDKRLKKAASIAVHPTGGDAPAPEPAAPSTAIQSRLPWILLACSWGFFGVYWALN